MNHDRQDRDVSATLVTKGLAGGHAHRTLLQSLDLPAIEQLEEALEPYDGALLLVTHDRRLLDHVRLDQRWQVREGRVSSR